MLNLDMPGDLAAVLAASFTIGIVVGLTGMGGGALMTPALIFLGAGNASAIVTADLTAAAVYKTGGAIVHARYGAPDFRLARLLIFGSVPMAFVGPFWINAVIRPELLEPFLQAAIGMALLIAAGAYALRLYLGLRYQRRGKRPMDAQPQIRPLSTLLVGAIGGLLVGITSVGSGSVIMVALVMLYPTLSALRLVGTDLIQAIPLVLSAAVGNILVHGLNWSLVVPLIIGSVPGSVLGSRLAPKVPQSVIRRGIVIVLTMSGVALLDKSGWLIGEKKTRPMLIAWTALAMILLMPLFWGILRMREGLPFVGHPTVGEIEQDVGSSNPT
jgi:uncharacterized membrane protein YfcA